MDLGTKPNQEPAMPPTSSPEAPKISYPGFSLNDKTAETFLTDNPVDLGDTITATVKLKVTRLEKSSFGHSLGFDVLSLDNISASADDKEGEDTDDGEGDEEAPGAETETKALGYKRPKVVKETPVMSAKDLTD